MASSQKCISSSSSSSLEDLEQQNSMKSPSLDPFQDSAKYFDNCDLPTSVMDMPKREDNPFSFKHFLNEEPSHYQQAGARPKIYPTNQSHATIESNETHESQGVYNRNPTELPDFVQDHLVIEQCYLNQDRPSSVNAQMVADVDNLPDFTLNSVESRPLRHRNEMKKQNVDGDLPFDLTGNLKKCRSHNRLSNSVLLEVVDGSPHFGRHQEVSPELVERVNFLLDLPVRQAELPNSSDSIDRNHLPHESVNIQKSLPDFLNDGPIRNRVIPQSDSNNLSKSNEPLDQRLQLENELLQHNLEIARRQNIEKTRRIQVLEAELLSRRAVDREETVHLEKAMEQVEDDLKRSTRRAVNAESTVTTLKQEIKTLMAEISVLRTQNRGLRNTIRSECCDQEPLQRDKKVQSLAGDLRNAALTADSLLKQLMSGVDNLKIIASTLENIDRIGNKTKDFLLDFDDDNAAGPVL